MMSVGNGKENGNAWKGWKGWKEGRKGEKSKTPLVS
jgi:hypothetical protein